ncbi:CLUMA_CG011909, isoform B [Clunio marinus]|uniref:non-specific serine/threonine protein kinase n=1 Tax=Clunio marinus TaxID=568069 RepID=A0A1J1IJE0_9DIPT|nr:CLUMA_CG011909, isoform B [Clunio marinus]
MKRKRSNVDHDDFNNAKNIQCNTQNGNFKQLENDQECCDSKVPYEFILTREIAENVVLCDISGNYWKIGAPIGKGSFGEIFLVSNDPSRAVNVENSKYVTKIEPHSNGPLFVEIHCLMNVNKCNNEEDEHIIEDLVGIPKYIASGSHYFNNTRYRFLIMPRYKTDLHSIIKNSRLNQKHLLIIATQIIDVLKQLHSKNYVHSDIKAENIMIGQCESTVNSNEFERNGKQPLSGTNPFRSCRLRNFSLFNNESDRRNLRPIRSIAYAMVDENSKSSHTVNSGDESDEKDEDFELSPRKRKARRQDNKKKGNLKKKASSNKNIVLNAEKSSKTSFSNQETDDRVFIIDYGLATKFIDTNGEHKPFCMDQRRAHDGTLEFTSRDAHFGVHSRRSDLECLGYNLVYWSQGFLPWKDDKFREQPEIVHRLKEFFMTDAKEIMKLLYGKNCPKFLGEFMHYVSRLEFDEEPDYDYLKGLFKKEFLRLGYQESDMKLNLSELRKACKPNSKTFSETELMISSITDLKTARQLGFLIATDSTDDVEVLSKPNDSIVMNLSCKSSPKNLRSNGKAKTKRAKRQPKVTEKKLIAEKLAQGKKLSIAEISTLDPDQIARERANREYEKFDEKIYYQTPRRFKGNPTYAILEIQNKMRNRLSTAAHPPIIAPSTTADIEHNKNTVKSHDERENDKSLNQYRCSELQSNRKSRVEKQTRAASNVNKRKEKKPERKQKRGKQMLKIKDDISALKDKEITAVEHKETRLKKNVKSKIKELPPVPMEISESSSNTSEDTAQFELKRKRKRTKIMPSVLKSSIETEDDSVYYDIPGEGSSDSSSLKDMSEDENVPKIIHQTGDILSADENSNQGSTFSRSSNNNNNKRGNRRTYYADDDYTASADEVSDVSSETNLTKSSASFRPKRNRKNFWEEHKNDKIRTRNQKRSRSKSRSAGQVSEVSNYSDISEACNDSEYQIPSDDESPEELDDQDEGREFGDSETEENYDDESNQSEAADNSNDSEDSIDIKYSPIKTRHARKRVTYFDMKHIRGRRINTMNEGTRNFRLVSTQG